MKLMRPARFRAFDPRLKRGRISLAAIAALTVAAALASIAFGRSAAITYGPQTQWGQYWAPSAGAVFYFQGTGADGESTYCNLNNGGDAFCPQTGSISYAAVPQGPNVFVYRGKSSSGSFFISYPWGVDTIAPGRVQNLTVAGGSDWHQTNGFDITWTNPAQPANSSPFRSAHYRITGPNGYDSGVKTVSGGSVESLDNLQLPGPGDFVLTVWQEDSAGNQGVVETTHLRLDNARPPDSSPRAANGWLSPDEFPYTQTWDEITSQTPGYPVSGIAGYAVRIDENENGDPCAATDRCTAPETNFQPSGNTSTQISALNEGNHYVHVAAVSGAGLKSTNVKTTPLRVDKTDPTSTITGIPSGWTNQNVVVEAHGEDALSGMSPVAEDSGQPITAISVDGASPQTALAPTNASVGITAEGNHLVTYWARDLAGNVNDGKVGPSGVQHNPPNAANVMIDKTSPEVAFQNAQDPNDPELVRAPAFDVLSGIGGGTIAYRRAGTGDAFTELPTQFVGGALEARFPADDVDQNQSYEFRAIANDLAGNSRTTGARADGSAMILANPIKLVPRLSAAWSGGPSNSVICRKRKGKTRKARVKARRAYRKCRKRQRLAQTSSVRLPFGSASTVSGRLTDAAGIGVPGARITITEVFDPGAVLNNRATSVSTDSAGNWSAGLGSGPSRVITATFAGDRRIHRVSAAPIRAESLSAVSFRAAPRRLHNRHAVQFLGAVASGGGQLPPGGKLVQVQYYDAQRKTWRPVAVIRSDGSGRFFTTYRFRTIRRTTRIKFRAISVAEGGWPFAETSSAPVTVKVLP